MTEPRGITPNFISAQKLKIEFSLFYPLYQPAMPVDISPEN